MPGRTIRRWPTATTILAASPRLSASSGPPSAEITCTATCFSVATRARHQTVPFSQYDSKNPEDLWTYMEDFEEKTGGEVLAIPHNGNLSNGRMFTVESFDGKPLTEDSPRCEPASSHS